MPACIGIIGAASQNITCTCHQLKITICCQTTLGAPSHHLSSGFMFYNKLIMMWIIGVYTTHSEENNLNIIKRGPNR